jgi:hypothetical protein
MFWLINRIIKFFKKPKPGQEEEQGQSGGNQDTAR